MIPLDVLLVFTLASAALALAPGPDNIFVLSQSMLHGRRAGICVTLGLCTGLVVHIAAVAMGIAAVLKASAVAFTVLKVLGASYLLYLAWQSFRAGSANLRVSAGALSGRALYIRGILMNVSNPKVAMFFLAFLPQFADPSHGPVTLQILVLGGIFMGAALVLFTLIAWTAGRLGDWLAASSRRLILMNKLTGTVFVILAGRLLLGQR